MVLAQTKRSVLIDHSTSLGDSCRSECGSFEITRKMVVCMTMLLGEGTGIFKAIKIPSSLPSAPMQSRLEMCGKGERQRLIAVSCRYLEQQFADSAKVCMPQHGLDIVMEFGSKRAEVDGGGYV